MQNTLFLYQKFKIVISDDQDCVISDDRSHKSRDTKPEMLLRSALHVHGYRFRLHCKELPGKPDIVLPKYNTVIFVNGCFWHRHQDCKRCTTPSTNQKYWLAKFQRNKERDKDNIKKLSELGWKVIVIWECHINKDIQKVITDIQNCLSEK